MVEAVDTSATLEESGQPHIPSYGTLRSWDDARLAQYIDDLKSNADRNWSVDPNISLNYASVIQHVGDALQRPDYVALGLMAQGDAVKNMGFVTEAWQLLNRAGDIFQQVNNEVGWARTRIGLVFVAVEVGEFDNIQDDIVRARDILGDAGLLQKLIFLDMNLATVYHKRGEIQQALVYYNTALQMALSLGKEAAFILWPIHYNMAISYFQCGQFKEAVNNYEFAIQAAFDQNQTRNAVMALTGYAELLQSQSKYRQALLLLHQATDLAEDKYAWDKLAIQSTMAECYLNLNRFYEARGLMHDILSRLKEMGLKNNVARMLVHLATAEANLRNYQSALHALNDAEQFLDDTQQSVWLGRQYLLRGQIALRQSRLIDAMKDADKAELLAPESVTAAKALILKGRVHLMEGQPRQAQLLVRRALQLSCSRQLERVRYSAYVLLGYIAEADQRYIHARHCYEAAIATMVRSYRNLTITLRSNFLDDKQDASHALIHLFIQMGQSHAAFAALEQTKSNALMHYLNNQDSLRWRNITTSKPQVREEISRLLAELEELRAEHYHYHSLIYGDSALDNDTFNTQKQAITSDIIRQYEERIYTVRERLYLISKNDRLLQQNSPPPLADIQANLSPDDLLIAYYNDGSAMWAFTLNATHLQLHPLPLSAAEVDRLISKLQANIEWALNSKMNDPLIAQLTDRYCQTSQQLYHALFAPFQAHIADAKRLTIVPYGSLHTLAFNTLFTGDQYLIEGHEIVLLPSISLLTREPITAPEFTARIIGHNHSDNLPHVMEEVHALETIMSTHMRCEVYLNDRATRRLLSLPPTQILHIAAHGEYRFDAPEFSYLQLGDGHLMFDDVLQYDLRCELVMLNGCETGRSVILAGDDLMGIGRGFLYAGAASVISSLWRVDDAASYHIANQFYQSVIDGNSKSSAIRQAQINALYRQPNLHPSYWGALQLIGDPRPLSSSSNKYDRGIKDV